MSAGGKGAALDEGLGGEIMVGAGAAEGAACGGGWITGGGGSGETTTGLGV